MPNKDLDTALISETFADDPQGDRLRSRLREARERGAELAILPELPLNRWAPAHRQSDPGDAEPPEGPRHCVMASAARRVGIALLGGAIVQDPETGARHNTALLFHASGELLSIYRKIHLPFEDGFWEAAHYKPGKAPPRVMTGLPLPVGVQICSDANRTTGCQLLAAQGAAIIIHPRATPTDTWPRWRTVLRADAITAACWLISVNRPPEDPASPIGGPSVVIAPDGEIVSESTDGMALVRIDGGAVVKARDDYPGYLEFLPEVYRDGWSALCGHHRS